MKTKTQNSQKSNTAVFLAIHLWTCTRCRCYLQHLHDFVSVNFEINLKKRLYDEPYPSILVGKMEH